MLGGVRGDNPSIAADRGLPSDISCVVQSEITKWCVFLFRFLCNYNFVEGMEMLIRDLTL